MELMSGKRGSESEWSARTRPIGAGAATLQWTKWLMYRSTSGSTGIHRDDRPKRQKRSEGDRGLASGVRALAGHHDGTDEHAREQRDQDRRCDRPTEEEPHTAASLTSPMPMPPG